MKLSSGKERWMMKLASGILGIALALALSGPGAWAQTETTETTPAKPSQGTVETFYLSNVSQQNDAIEILNAVRNMLPNNAKSYFVPSQNAIILWTTPDQILLARKLIKDLDRPKKTYRLTYTTSEMDGGKRIGIQHVAIIVVSGGKTNLKQGSKVPYATGAENPGSTAQNAQVSYFDVGLSIDASLDEFVDGVRLRTKIEQSSIAEEKSSVGPQDPVVRQTVLEGTAILTLGKPLTLGSLDIPGSTRHQDVEVLMEVVR